jgi:hypothetical protein
MPHWQGVDDERDHAIRRGCRQNGDMAQGGEEQKTWNSPEQIARHRAMSMEERLKLCIELSRAALQFRDAQRPGRAE